MHSYILTGIRMGPLMKLLRKHGFTARPRNLTRLMFIMHNAFWASFFTWRERKSFEKAVNSWPVPEDPVIIIGHWRTGSTLLHLLLAGDEQFIAPSLFQSAFPDCFLSAEKFYRPIMGRMVNKRPMDNVSVGFDDAQEDEFALLKLTLDSPLMNFIFPEKKGYFISNYEDFNPSQEYYSIWKEKMTGFCKKVVRNSGRTILLKNPAHSLRIPLLRELFPKARFIHIHRHPFDVVPSSMHLWETLLKDNLLKGKPEIPDVEEVARGLNKFYSLISRDMALIPKGYKSVIAYEDLIQDPVKCIRKCYHDLKVQFTDDFELSIHAYMQQNKAFRKKSYTFGNEDKEKVYQEMKRFFKLHNYSMHP